MQPRLPEMLWFGFKMGARGAISSDNGVCGNSCCAEVAMSN